MSFHSSISSSSEQPQATLREDQQSAGGWLWSGRVWVSVLGFGLKEEATAELADFDDVAHARTAMFHSFTPFLSINPSVRVGAHWHAHLSSLDPFVIRFDMPGPPFLVSNPIGTN